MWTQDGSGLQVKRIRGRTISQRIVKASTSFELRPKWARSVMLGPSDKHMGLMAARRRNRAERRQNRRGEAACRWLNQRFQYRSVQHRAEPRRLRRRAAREALESMAKDMGLELRPGEFTRDLRARMTVAMLDVGTSRVGIGQPETPPTSAPFEVPKEWDRLEIMVDGKPLRIPGVAYPPTMGPDMVDKEYRARLRAAMDKLSGQAIVLPMDAQVEVLTPRELMDLRLVETKPDGTRVWKVDRETPLLCADGKTYEPGHWKTHTPSSVANPSEEWPPMLESTGDHAELYRKTMDRAEREISKAITGRYSMPMPPSIHPAEVQADEQIRAKWTGAFAGPCQGICCNPRTLDEISPHEEGSPEDYERELRRASEKRTPWQGQPYEVPMGTNESPEDYRARLGEAIRSKPR
jgi:hypothetical protein